MTTDFDAIIDRRNTHSTKWDDIESRCGVVHPDPIPLWVADMDFRAPQTVTDMLREAVDHGHVRFVKISEKDNVADAMTKPVAHGVLQHHLEHVLQAGDPLALAAQT